MSSSSHFLKHAQVDLSAHDALNLGEVLRGSRILDTPYDFRVGVNQNCKIMCRSEYDKEEVQAFSLMIEEEYRAHLLLDNLPIAMVSCTSCPEPQGPVNAMLLQKPYSRTLPAPCAVGFPTHYR